MSRIVNEAGVYDPQRPVVPETVEVPASELPQIRRDAYADVDHRDFSNARSLSRVQQLTMAEIAHSRGDADAAMAWKQQGFLTQQAEANAAQAEAMNKMLAPPAPASPHGSQLVGARSDIPWENDEAYQELSADRSELQAKLEGFERYDDEFFDLSGRIAVVDDKLAARESELRESLAASGIWSEQNDRQVAANASLREKSNVIAESLHTPTTPSTTGEPEGNG